MAQGIKWQVAAPIFSTVSMRRRTAILTFVAATLLIFDSILVYDRCFRLNAGITYVGLDSLAFDVPEYKRASRFQNGKWDINPEESYQKVFPSSPSGQKTPNFYYVSLEPSKTFGHAITVLRDLKARRMCHILVRENADIFWGKTKFALRNGVILEIPVWVLCGTGYGDAGFKGNLPSDRLIHIPVRATAQD